MARRTTKCIMGTSNDDLHNYRGNTLPLAFGGEAIILAEIWLTSYKVAHHDEPRNEEGMQLQLDLLDEVRMMVEQRIMHYQDLMAKHYNTKVKPRHF